MNYEKGNIKIYRLEKFYITIFVFGLNATQK